MLQVPEGSRERVQYRRLGNAASVAAKLTGAY
jgi:hypothetical protein